MTSVQTSASVPQLSDPISSTAVMGDDVSHEKRALASIDDITKSKPTKRARKDFSNQLYSRVIKSALDSLDNKNPESIDLLTSQIMLPASNPDALTPNSLSAVLTMLSQQISRLDSRRTTPLIRALLKYDWLTHLDDEQFIQSYSTFLAVLVSGMPKWFIEVCNKLIGDFTKGSEDKIAIVHRTLKYIIQLSPASFNNLPGILRKNFPNKNSSKEDLINYSKNLLYLLSYCGDLRYPVWSLLIKQLISLDVELQNEIDEVDDEQLDDALESSASGDDDDGDDQKNNQSITVNASAVDATVTETAYESEDEEGESELMNEGEEEEYNVEMHTISDLSGKLDSIMKLLFERTNNSFTKESLDSGDGVLLFGTLIKVFKTYILPTHYTRCIQYLMFHIVQKQPSLTDSFLVMLIDVLFNKKSALSERVKAMQYLSSFLARAKSVSRTQLLSVMKYLMDWCSEYVSERENEIGNGLGGMDRFLMLYAILQGLMYIFCFRYNEFKKENNDGEWELRMDKFFNKMIMSKFNPLKFCNETVVLIFARIVQKVNLCYCFSIIEKNKRDRLNGVLKNAGEESSGDNFERKQEFLDWEAYFPFDPLVLKSARRIISPNYIEWQNTDDSDDDDSD